MPRHLQPVQNDAHKLSDASQKILLGDRGEQGAGISALFGLLQESTRYPVSRNKYFAKCLIYEISPWLADGPTQQGASWLCGPAKAPNPKHHITSCTLIAARDARRKRSPGHTRSGFGK
jgi:hypothetical protein